MRVGTVGFDEMSIGNLSYYFDYDLSLAICLCAITSTIMGMFSVDKSFAENTEKGLFGGFSCCLLELFCLNICLCDIYVIHLYYNYNIIYNYGYRN